MLYWESSNSMGWPCCQSERWKVTKAPAVWRTVRGEEVYWVGLTQTLQRLLPIFPNGFCDQQRFLGKPAAERGTWRSVIRKGAELYEQTRIRQAEEKRLLGKSSAAETSSAIITALQCPNCDRTFRARIGFISHIRTHRLHATDQWCHGHHPRRMDEQQQEELINCLYIHTLKCITLAFDIIYVSITFNWLYSLWCSFV